MKNKLQDIFDENAQDLTETLFFDGPQNYNNFVEAINRAIAEGKSSIVEGVKGIKICINDAYGQYLIEEHRQGSPQRSWRPL